MNTGHKWNQQETDALISAWDNRRFEEGIQPFADRMAKSLKLSASSIDAKIQRMIREGEIKRTIANSPYPVYKEPLRMEGDALIMGDCEFPFHHADFINRCLDLAQKWKIKQCILGGDVLHFDSLSGWGPNWKNDNEGELSERLEEMLMNFAMTLKKGDQGRAMELITNLGRREEQDGASTEMDIARRELLKLTGIFDQIDFVIGNHEGRFLRAMDTALSPKELLRLLELNSPKWRIAPYYYSTLVSGGVEWQIEHPTNSGKGTSKKLASKFTKNIIMLHNHHYSIQSDPSGNFVAIETGCCVDEDRLPYASQRHGTADAHILGACIVRGGYGWPLNKFSDWSALKRA